MNREIKFRAWIPEVNVMLDSVDVYDNNTIGICPDNLELPDDLYLDDDDCCIKRKNPDEFAFDYHVISPLFGEDYIWFEKFELMQFTGLKDKNGTEIYEGDVVQLKFSDWGTSGVVQFNTIDIQREDCRCKHIATCWCMEYLDKSGHSPITSVLEEVIGNIYQNPELINS